MSDSINDKIKNFFESFIEPPPEPVKKSRRRKKNKLGTDKVVVDIIDQYYDERRFEK